MLYEVVVGNHGDDRNYSKLILSNEPLLEIENNERVQSLVKSLIKLDEESEFIIKVGVPDIIINAWNINEFNEMDTIRKSLY